MKTRRNPKHRNIYEAGNVKDYENKNKKRLRQIWYIRKVAKQAAIEANMIRVLTIAKSNDPTLHLQFWLENLRSDYPVIELKKSNLKHGGLGAFVTTNCVFLPKGLMYLPNLDGPIRDEAAEPGSIMAKYQFAIKHEGRTKYIFPTLEPNTKLPCAQFINTPLRKTQGKYSAEVKPNLHQAMHIGNTRLLGRSPGGFIGNQVIYPGFEILGSYCSSYSLPTVADYDINRKEYEKHWKEETHNALVEERKWKRNYREHNRKQIKHWEAFASSVRCKVTQEEPIITIEDYESS